MSKQENPYLPYHMLSQGTIKNHTKSCFIMPQLKRLMGYKGNIQIQYLFLLRPPKNPIFVNYQQSSNCEKSTTVPSLLLKAYRSGSLVGIRRYSREMT